MEATLFVGSAESKPEKGLSMLERGYTAFRQLLCQHDDLPKFAEKRMYMECIKCQRQTPGVEITGRPRPRFEGDAARHRLS